MQPMPWTPCTMSSSGSNPCTCWAYSSWADMACALPTAWTWPMGHIFDTPDLVCLLSESQGLKGHYGSSSLALEQRQDLPFPNHCQESPSQLLLENLPVKKTPHFIHSFIHALFLYSTFHPQISNLFPRVVKLNVEIRKLSYT